MIKSLNEKKSAKDASLLPCLCSSDFQDMIQTIEGDVAIVGVPANKALYLTADPTWIEDMEQLVPTEVNIQEMSSYFYHLIIL